MRYLRWVGVVSSLVIGGLILAPVQSEASGTSIQIQSGPNSTSAVVYNGLESILGGPTSCPSTSYTRCFLITLGSKAGVTVAAVPGSTAKLLIGDFTGAGNKLDVITLSGVKFTSPDRTVKVIFTHKFDDAPNSGGGTFSFAARIGGFFQAGTPDSTSVNDYVKLSGGGGFFSIPQLSYTVGGAATASNPFSLQNASPYPAGTCPSPCTPTITQTMTFVLKGADSLNLTNSVDGGGSDCNLGSEGTLGPGGNPARPCHSGQNSLANKITGFLNDAAQADIAAFSQLVGAAPLNVSCTENCTQDPDLILPGTIRINKDICNYICSGRVPETFTFIITGPTSTTATVTTDSVGIGYVDVGGLSPGMYTVSEIARVDWSLTTDSNTCGQGASVEVQEGGNVACNFVNRFHGD